MESQGPKLEIKFIASEFSHYQKTHGKKKSSPKYWKASHQLLIHWFPNFNNTQHFYNYRPKGRFFQILNKGK